MPRLKPGLHAPFDCCPVLHQLIRADSVFADDFAQSVTHIVTQKHNIVSVGEGSRVSIYLGRHYRCSPKFQSTTTSLPLFAAASCCSSSARSASSTLKTLMRGDVLDRDSFTQSMFSASQGTCIVQSPAVGFQVRGSRALPSSTAFMPYRQ